MGENSTNTGLENAHITRISQYFTLCEQNAEFLIVKAGGTYSYRWVLKG
jgi:hypothetical protein